MVSALASRSVLLSIHFVDFFPSLKIIRAVQGYEVGTYLFWVSKGMTIHAVVGSVQLTVEEPGSIAVVETTVLDSVERLGPGEELSGHLVG